MLQMESTSYLLATSVICLPRKLFLTTRRRSLLILWVFSSWRRAPRTRITSSKPSRQWPRTSSSELHRNQQLVVGQAAQLCPQDDRLTLVVVAANKLAAQPNLWDYESFARALDDIYRIYRRVDFPEIFISSRVSDTIKQLASAWLVSDIETRVCCSGNARVGRQKL
mmetsp:Transcript_102219/g.161320  ORF Transcript_102219/g.161320 Transcript_102219/m.161320 type:complete len:167 (+) Transcript_102219:384-884(+)